MALGEALLRTRAREAGLAYELLAARADLQAIVAAVRAGGPGRRAHTARLAPELAGAELLELLNGRVALSVAGRGDAAAAHRARSSRARSGPEA